MNDCDEILADWTEALCAKAAVDDHLSAVLLVVRELHAALAERRPMNPDYSVMLAQALTAADFCAVHGILIEASCQKATG